MPSQRERHRRPRRRTDARADNLASRTAPRGLRRSRPTGGFGPLLAPSATGACPIYGALSKTERRTRALPRIHQPVRTMWSSRASLEFKKPCKLLRQAWA